MCAFANEVISRGGVLPPVVPDPLIPSSLYFHHPPPYLPTRLNAIYCQYGVAHLSLSGTLVGMRTAG